MLTRLRDRCFVNEVVMRDGLQIEERFVTTSLKVGLLNDISRTGVSKIEVSSFTSPKTIPSLSDADAVFGAISRTPGVIYSALVPNHRGAERAIAADVDEVNLVMSASESHSRANLRMTTSDSMNQFRDIVIDLPPTIKRNVSISTAFGCPFEGAVSTEKLLNIVESLTELGFSAITLCDTTGIANPRQVEALFHILFKEWPQLTLTAHFHDTRGLGLANALSAYDAGVRHFDSSLGGLGGCPYAPGASGNVCTEDMIHMFKSMNIDCSVDLQSLCRIARQLPDIIGHPVPGKVMRAGPATRRYPLPR
jgi:hydroxymethylglutaryl-CoA lyase